MVREDITLKPRKMALMWVTVVLAVVAMVASAAVAILQKVEAVVVEEQKKQ